MYREVCPTFKNCRVVCLYNKSIKNDCRFYLFPSKMPTRNRGHLTKSWFFLVKTCGVILCCESDSKSELIIGQLGGILKLHGSQSSLLMMVCLNVPY